MKVTLLSSLISAGEARVDTHGLGLDLTDDLSVRRRDGSGHDRLWAIGPIARGVFWECTAVPDTRRNTETLAGIVCRALA